LVAILVLASLGIFLGGSFLYAYSLLILAICLFALLVVRRIRRVKVKIYYDQVSAFNAANEIYKIASREGGRLIATHIRPKDPDGPTLDIAAQHLKKVEKPLEYKRFIFSQDEVLEDKWIRDSLYNFDPEVQRSIYFVKRSMVMPNVIWSVMPRANILLYNKGNRYWCLLGLDQLQTTDEQYRRYNFAVEFRTQEAFDIMYRYFESLVANPHVQNVKSTTQYPLREQDTVIKPEIQSALTDLQILASSNDEVDHVGVFGKIAIYVNGLKSGQEWREHESDIDVMIIVSQGSKSKVKEMIGKKFADNHVGIVWGDDLEYFYFFRDPDKITVDVEVVERGGSFYKDHPLLGCSIFSFYYTIYQKTGSYLHELLEIPYGYDSMDQRMKILLNDRKGLKEFRNRMNGNLSEIDPRRIVSLCVRNLAWAITGVRPIDTYSALAFLSPYWTRYFPTTKKREIEDLLGRDTGEVRKSYRDCRELSETLVNDAIAFCRHHH
jgi:hypothetical protein